MGAVDIVYLLSSIWSSGVFENEEYTEFTNISRMASYTHFSLSQLVIKPDSLLLEDQRSEASGERDNQTNVLFLELVLICDVFKFLFKCMETKVSFSESDKGNGY